MVAVYAFTSILSAFLVFFIQPVVAKLALPTLGGTPIVWSGCMLFFQAMLLGGYVYAHLLTRKVPYRLQPTIHLVLLAAALSLFPLSFGAGEGIDPVYSPLHWLLATLLYSVGLPFFAISASSPLLQRWFSQTGHKDAHNPYFLYAAGNAGSMGALLLYPVALEPLLPLLMQVHLWEMGVCVLAVSFCAVAWVSRTRGAASHVAAPDASRELPPIGWRQRGRWLVLSFIPASLLYGVTTYITTDIASVPLLWIIPLVLYLLTFIVAFSDRLPGVKTAFQFHIPIGMLLLLLLAIGAHWSTLALSAHVVGFYFIVLSLHGQLAGSKPTPERLTEFFLWVSLGGVLGGIFNTLVAPFIFNSIVEYPLMLVVSLLARHELRMVKLELMPRWHIVLGMFLATLVVISGTKISIQGVDWEWTQEQLAYVRVAVTLLLLVLIYISSRLLKDAMLAFSLCVAFVAMGLHYVRSVGDDQLLFQERSVYGVYKVTQQSDKGAMLHTLLHGTTLHGIQLFAKGQELAPRSYYTKLEDIIATVGVENATRPMMVIGLGAGTMACYGKEGQTFDFYEIDPLVARIASDPAFFTYLRDCPANVRVILGDGRMKLAEQPDGHYGVMMIDAFSSDAIPMHLLTREAVALYLQKLAPQGVLAIHISNRHINLRPVLSAIAEDLGVQARVRWRKEDPAIPYSSAALWVVLSRDQGVVDTLDTVGEWEKLPPANKRHFLWRDDFSNIFLSLIPLQKLLDL